MPPLIVSGIPDPRMNTPATPPLELRPHDVCVQLEPGEHWTGERVEELLRRTAAIDDGGERLAALAAAFVAERTPFEDESELAPPPDGAIRVRFASFDCITFIYSLYALHGARTFDDVPPLLARIRYAGRPEQGNLIHYAWNSLRNIMRLGLARDVTAELLDPRDLAVRSVTLGVKDDGTTFLPHPRAGDPNIGERVSVAYIPGAAVNAVESLLRTGDTIVFVTAWPPARYPGIVGHAALVHREEGTSDAFLLHAGKSRVGSPEGRRAGVSLLTEWDAERRVLADGGPLCPLHRYLEHHADRFAGIVVLRPLAPAWRNDAHR